MMLLLQEFCARGSNITDASSHFPFVNGSNVGQLSTKEYQAITFKTIWLSLQINCVIAVVQLLLFWILLRWKPHIFAPRLDPKEVPKWPLGWACKVWHVTKMGRGKSARQIAERLNNLDGAIMVRFCILGLKFSVAGSLCACFLIPWYRDSSPEQEDPLTEYNLANLKEGNRADHRFWPAIVTAYVLTMVFVHFSIDEWCNFDVMRKEHFTRLASGHMEADRPGAAQAQRSILVELVPPRYRAVGGVAVHAFFSKLFPHDGVHSAVVQAETGELHGKVDAVMMYEGKKTLRLLREALAPQLRRAKEEREHQETLERIRTQQLEQVPEANGMRRAISPSGMNVAEGFMHRAQQAAILVQDIILAHDGGVNVGSSTAFVTFNSVSDRVAAEQMVLCQSDMQALTRQGWYVTSAPEAPDIVWKNAAVPHTQAWARTTMVRIVLFFSMIFWVIPIAVLTVWTRIDNWHFPWIAALQQNVVGLLLYTFVASYLPVLAQMGLLYALPVLLEQLAVRVEGEKVKSRIQITVVGRYLGFLMVTIYCTIVGGSMLESLCEILEQPWDLFDLLQREVPQVASYFITYAMARAGLSAPMLLLFALFSAFEPKDKHGRIIIRPNYAMEAANLVLMLALGMTYCVIAPTIMFACAAYFALTSLIYSWLFLYVYTPEYDCHGKMWQYMFVGSIWSLLFGVAALTGIASTYVGPTSGSFAACLVLCCIIVIMMFFFQFTYDEPSEYIPLEVAREVDRCAGGIVETFKTDYYFDPVITGQSHGLLSSEAGCCFCCRRHRLNQSREANGSTSQEESGDEEEITESTSEEEDPAHDSHSERSRRVHKSAPGQPLITRRYTG